MRFAVDIMKGTNKDQGKNEEKANKGGRAQDGVTLRLRPLGLEEALPILTDQQAAEIEKECLQYGEAPDLRDVKIKVY